MTRPRRSPLPAALLACLLTALPAVGVYADGGPDHDRFGDHDQDHERARAAVREGRALPLDDIVAKALASFGGTVLDVDFEEHDDGHGPGGDDGRQGGGRYRNGPPAALTYDIKLLTAGGQVMKLIYDAASGDLLAVRGRRHHGGSHQDGD